MAHWHTYKCDKCNTEQSTPEQFWSLGIIYAHTPNFQVGHISSYTSGIPYQINLCRSCMEGLGFFQRVIESPLEAPKPHPGVRVMQLAQEIMSILKNNDEDT